MYYQTNTKTNQTTYTLKEKKKELLVLAMRKDLSQNTSCVKTALNL